MFNKVALNKSNMWRNLQTVSCAQRKRECTFHRLWVAEIWICSKGWRLGFAGLRGDTGQCPRHRMGLSCQLTHRSLLQSMSNLCLLGLGMAFASWLLKKARLLFLINYFFSPSCILDTGFFMQVRKLSCGHRNHSEITVAISYPVWSTANSVLLRPVKNISVLLKGK